MRNDHDLNILHNIAMSANEMINKSGQRINTLTRHLILCLAGIVGRVLTRQYAD